MWNPAHLSKVSLGYTLYSITLVLVDYIGRASGTRRRTFGRRVGLDVRPAEVRAGRGSMFVAFDVGSPQGGKELPIIGIDDLAHSLHTI